MKITHLLKVTLLGLMLSLLAGCQSAPKGLTLSSPEIGLHIFN
ncbi:hypothetical protein ACK39T_19450 [Aeromonas veronii]